MSKELEAFSRMSDMLSEYEDFICELPYCPDWETEYDWSDAHTVSVALEEKENQDKILRIVKRALLYSYVNRDILNRAFEEGWITEEEHKIAQGWLEEKEVRSEND